MNSNDPFIRSRAFFAACKMPSGLKNWPYNSKPYDFMDSEVIAWLIAQPEIREWVFEQFQMSGALIYNGRKPGVAIRRLL